MDFASEAAIAGEMGKFLMNGALYRGLRPVLWSPVEKTALAEAEVEYHDHTSTTIWVRFPVVRPSVPALSGASLVIWTTTPWTMPGNRAIAAGAEFDYALVHVDGVEEGSLARKGERLLVRWRCCRSSWRMPASPRIISSMCSKARSWLARCAPIRCEGAATSRIRRCCLPIS